MSKVHAEYAATHIFMILSQYSSPYLWRSLCVYVQTPCQSGWVRPDLFPKFLTLMLHRHTRIDLEWVTTVWLSVMRSFVLFHVYIFSFSHDQLLIHLEQHLDALTNCILLK